MMEHTTDRLFWTLSAIIIGALILTLSAKAFPKAAQSVIAPMSGLVKQADNATSATVTNAITANTSNDDNGYTPEQGLTPVTNTNGPTNNSSTNDAQTQAQIDALNKKNQDLTDKVNSQSNQLVSFNNQVSTLQNQNQVFTTQLQTFQNNLAAQQAQNDQLNTQLQNALNAAAAQKTIDEQTIATITKQNQDLYQQVQDANNKAAESAGNYTADINRLTNQLQVLQNNYASMAGLGKNVDDINNQIINVVKQIQAAQAGQQSLASTISNMNSTAQQQFANYQSQLNLSNQTISDLAQKVQNNNDLITSLQQQLNAANNAIGNLQNGVKNAQQTADNAQNTANNAQNSANNANNTANNAQNTANNANNTANSALSQAQQAINAVNNTLQFRGEWQGEYWDWNTHQDGIYSVDRGPGQNFLPSGFSGWGQLTLTTSGGGNDRFAELKDNVGHIFYQHQFSGSGGFTGWVEMATKDDVNNAQNTANNANNTANNANNTANNAQNTANWAGGVANNAQNTANNAQNTANAANWRANNSLYIGQTLGGGTRIRDIQGSGVYFLDGSWYLGLPGGRDGNVWGQLVVYNGGGVVNQILYNNTGQIWRRSINSWGTTSWDQV